MDFVEIFTCRILIAPPAPVGFGDCFNSWLGPIGSSLLNNHFLRHRADDNQLSWRMVLLADFRASVV